MRSLELTESVIACLEQVDNQFEFTFERLRDLLLKHHWELQAAEVSSILDLFILLLHNAKLKDERDWIIKNATQFSFSTFVSDLWRRRFSEGKYSYSLLDNYVDDIKHNPSNINLEMSLKVVEITLRDDVIFSDIELCKSLCKRVLIDIFDPPISDKNSRQAHN